MRSGPVREVVPRKLMPGEFVSEPHIFDCDSLSALKLPNAICLAV